MLTMPPNHALQPTASARYAYIENSEIKFYSADDAAGNVIDTHQHKGDFKEAS
jgi:hypothetical protein